MPLFTQPNLTSGVDQAIITTAQSVPAFPIMMLIFTFLVILIGGASSQKRRLGTADIPFWSVLAGLATTFEALIFSLGEGVIKGTTGLTILGIVIAITIMCAIWFFLSKVRGED